MNHILDSRYKKSFSQPCQTNCEQRCETAFSRTRFAVPTSQKLQQERMAPHSTAIQSGARDRPAADNASERLKVFPGARETHIALLGIRNCVLARDIEPPLIWHLENSRVAASKALGSIQATSRAVQADTSAGTAEPTRSNDDSPPELINRTRITTFKRL